MLLLAAENGRAIFWRTAMSYELNPDETRGDGLRRIITRQIENAIGASKARRNGRDSPVHQTRQHLKKARAALRLVRGEVERDVWKWENRCLGRVAKMISEVRDAEVRLETVRQLREIGPGKRRRFQETEELLAFELDSFLAAFAEWPEEAGSRLSETLRRVSEWPLEKLGCERVRRNVQKTYKLGKRALECASQKKTTTRFHALRKRVKDLGYQIRLLRPLGPVVFCDLEDELKTVGKCLGQLHDLAFVEQRLSSLGPAEKKAERVLSAVITARSDELKASAIALAERFYAERPRRFAHRLARYFRQWETVRVRCVAPAEKQALALIR